MKPTTKSANDTMRLAFEQMQEDRETIRESYEKFSEQMTNLNDYAVNGANVNKCLELLTKQTAQLLELAKLQSTIKKHEDASLTSDDRDELYESLKEVVSLHGNK